MLGPLVPLTSEPLALTAGVDFVAVPLALLDNKGRAPLVPGASLFAGEAGCFRVTRVDLTAGRAFIDPVPPIDYVGLVHCRQYLWGVRDLDGTAVLSVNQTGSVVASQKELAKKADLAVSVDRSQAELEARQMATEGRLAASIDESKAALEGAIEGKVVATEGRLGANIAKSNSELHGKLDALEARLVASIGSSKAGLEGELADSVNKTKADLDKLAATVANSKAALIGELELKVCAAEDRLGASIDGSKRELKGDIDAAEGRLVARLADSAHKTKAALIGELEAKVCATEDRLRASIDGSKSELKGDIDAAEGRLVVAAAHTRTELEGKLAAVADDFASKHALAFALANAAVSKPDLVTRLQEYVTTTELANVVKVSQQTLADRFLLYATSSDLCSALAGQQEFIDKALTAVNTEMALALESTSAEQRGAFEAALSGYVTSAVLDDRLADKVARVEFDARLGGAEARLRRDMAECVTHQALDGILKDTVTPTGLATVLQGYATQPDLVQALADKVTLPVLATKLGTYSKQTELAEAAAGLKTYVDDRVATLTAAAGSTATAMVDKAYVDSRLLDKADKTALAAVKTELKTALDQKMGLDAVSGALLPYAKQASVVAALLPKADRAYVDSSLAAKADTGVTDGLSVQIAALQARVTQQQLSEALVPYATKTGLAASVSDQKTYCDSRLAIEIAKLPVATKADKAYVDAQMVLKADAATVAALNNALGIFSPPLEGPVTGLTTLWGSIAALNAACAALQKTTASLQAQMERNAESHPGRYLVYESPAVWADRGQTLATGQVSGLAYVRPDEIRLTDAVTGAGYAVWPVHPGRDFTLAFEFRSGPTKTSVGGCALWVTWLATRFQAHTEADPLQPGAGLLAFDEVKKVVSLANPATPTKPVAVPTTALGDNTWHRVVLSRSAGGGLAVRLDGAKVLVSDDPPVTSTGRDLAPKYLVFGARCTTLTNNEHAIRNVCLWTRDPEHACSPLQHTMYVADMHFPLFSLVRRGRPPPDAVSFGTALNKGMVYAGFVVHPVEGFMPCRIAAVDSTAYYTLNGLSQSSQLYYYLIPREGFVAIRRRRIATTQGVPQNAVCTDIVRNNLTPVQNNLYMICYETTTALSYGRYEPRGAIEVEWNGLVSLDNAVLTWDFVCMVPMASRNKWVLLPRGMAPATAALYSETATYYSNFPEPEAIMKLAEDKNAVVCLQAMGQSQQTLQFTIDGMSAWPLRLNGVPNCQLYIRADEWEALKPQAHVNGKLYQTVDYHDSPRGLVWRWNAVDGWYLNLAMRVA